MVMDGYGADSGATALLDGAPEPTVLCCSAAPSPLRTGGAESAFGAVAAVVAAWNSFTFCDIDSVASRAAIGRQEWPPLPSPRAT